MSMKKTAAICAAAALIIAAAGCLPYFEKPKPEKWTFMNVPDHFAAVYNGEGDSSEQEWDFDCGGALAWMQMGNTLTSGRVEVLVKVKATSAVVMQTSSDQGFGPNVSAEIGNALPGVLTVVVTTQSASGSFSIKLDRWEPTPAQRRGFDHLCILREDAPQVASRTETYSWDNHDGNADLALKVGIGVGNTTEQVTVEVYDAAASSNLIESFSFSTAGEHNETRNWTGRTAGDWKIVVTRTITAAMVNDTTIEIALD